MEGAVKLVAVIFKYGLHLAVVGMLGPPLYRDSKISDERKADEYA